MGIVVLIVIGLAAGVLGAVCGVGGGIIVVPALLWLKGFDMRLAVGTSLAYIVPTAAWAVVRKAPSGQVDFRVAALLAIGGVLGATLGSYVADVLPIVWIKRAFAAFLVVVAAQLVRDA
jgi:uncharacterized membrane protein YfcA